MKDGVLTADDPPALFFVLAIGTATAVASTAASLQRIGGGTDDAVLRACALPFCVHLIGWIHGTYHKTEKYFDASFGISYLALIAAMTARSSRAPRHLLLSTLAALWTFRLVRFLYFRILRRKRDFRHDEMRKTVAFNAFGWCAQAAWVF